MPDLMLSDFVNKIEDIMPAVIKGFGKMHTNELSKGEITMPQFFVLSHLGKHGESKMNELAKVMDFSTAAATGIVDRLVRYGYIIRTYDPKDRRVVNVKLTQKGSDMVKRISRQRRDMALEIFGQISREERENYLSVMLHIRDILTRENKS